MSEPHAARDHASWSASTTERNWNCEGALALNDGVEDSTSVAADWGTVAHEISEDCLFDKNKDASEFIGQARKGKVHEIEVDEEMAEVVMAYVSYCRERVAAYKTETGQNALIFIEQNLPLDAIDPPFDAGGTGDFIAIFEAWHLIEVVDLKTGRGVAVKAENNAQARSYALGTMLKFTGYDINSVMSTIVQPRIGSGKPKSETYHVSDLVEWATDLKAKMLRSHEAKLAYEKVKAGELSLSEWSATHLRAGDHCAKTFCKARATCPALEKAVQDKVGLWFDNLDQPRLSNAMSGDDPAQISRDLDALDMIESWCNARRERAHMLAESGVEIPNYILVPKQGREKWNDGAEEQVIGAAVLAKLPESKYLTPGKLRTPKQIRKELGKQAHLVDGLSSTPEAGTNLVRADKTTRQAVAPAVHQHFQAIE